MKIRNIADTPRLILGKVVDVDEVIELPESFIVTNPDEQFPPTIFEVVADRKGKE